MKKDLLFAKQPIFAFGKKGTVFASQKQVKGVPLRQSFCQRQNGAPFSERKRLSNEHIFKEVGKEWKDYFGTESKLDKDKFDIETDDSEDLLDCYNKWRKEEVGEIISDSYSIAEKLLKKYKLPFLSENDINEFVVKIEEEHSYSGIFISTVINELYKGDEIHLSSDVFSCIGCCNENKKIVVEGNCGNWTGVYLKGGEIVVKGDCGSHIGNNMLDGEIKIYGNKFNPEKQISRYAKKGKIYHKNKLVWGDGKFMGDEI